MRSYLSRSADCHLAQAFFVTTIPPHRAATRITLRQWFARVLRGTGIDALPGSSWAAAASTAFVNGILVNAIMQAVDWTSDSGGGCLFSAKSCLLNFACSYHLSLFLADPCCLVNRMFHILVEVHVPWPCGVMHLYRAFCKPCSCLKFSFVIGLTNKVHRVGVAVFLIFFGIFVDSSFFS